MSFSFLLGDDDVNNRQVARVRNHTGDVTDGAPGVDYFLSDERILGFLDDEAENAATEKNIARLAAADALDVLATNEAYVQKVQSTLGESTDGARVADAIRAHAKSLRAQVAVAAESSVAATAQSFNRTLRRTDAYSDHCGDEYARCPPCP